MRGGEGAKLSQVRAAAALAKALNRSLVMPQLWCGLENLWSPHTGRSWGNSSEYRPPTECAMSQLFHLERYVQRPCTSLHRIIAYSVKE